MSVFDGISPYRVVSDFESVVSRYCGAKYGVAVDSCSNAILLSLLYEDIKGRTITIPNKTYVSVPCSILHAGGKVDFFPIEGKLKGAYPLKGSNVWDSALSFKRNMYVDGSLMCLSFSGPKKHLKLGKGGMILTNDHSAYEWLKLARYSGRHEIDHQYDNFAMVGWNFYMLPEIASRGLVLMLGMPDNNDDLEIEYQDLSKYDIYRRRQ